jgi:hypothetical protein
VLVKCLAQTLGSYKLVRRVTVGEVYKMVTNEQLSSASDWLQSQQGGLKGLKRLLKVSKEQESFLIARKEKGFFKVSSVVYVKSKSERQEEAERQEEWDRNKLGSQTEQVSYKTLEVFLDKKKMQIG